MYISKILFVLLFALLAMTIGSCNKEDDCYSEPIKAENNGWSHGGYNCLPESQSYCGCDGKTYTSKCEAQKAGVLHFVEGSCK